MPHDAFPPQMAMSFSTRELWHANTAATVSRPCATAPSSSVLSHGELSSRRLYDEISGPDCPRARESKAIGDLFFAAS